MRIGLDIGGTKIELVVLSEQGELLHQQRTPTPTNDYRTFLDAIINLIKNAESQVGTVSTIGVGCPGAISPDTGVIKNANCQVLNGHDLAADLHNYFNLPVKIANDADCLALSEFKDGAAKSASSSCFAAILGTGCGGGVVVNSQLVTGVNRIAGEWGHNPLPDWDENVDGPEHICYCGRTKCLESYISGSGVSQNFQQIYHKNLTVPEIVELAEQGDPCAVEHMARFYDQLARSFAVIINIIDPEVIVIGGGVSNISSIYSHVPKIWQKYVFSDQVHTKLVRAKHGDSSGVRGAAWL
ncbi:ROK family protein [Vibrio sp. 99-8-1]|uniref:ROK family protein n=1 Tax=Vibrio sp. 99-8-1 TaxID=2607602 RepID=UPI0014933AD1|nr:ROK family protein [Vibrio sp. 99-8-1]